LVGENPRPAVLTIVLVLGSTRFTVCSLEFKTQTPAAPTWTEVGVSPTGICWTTWFVFRSITPSEFGLTITDVTAVERPNRRKAAVPIPARARAPAARTARLLLQPE